jgi:hypothetical protein
VFRVTFTHAGTYDYICALHDNLGMVGKVIVKPWLFLFGIGRTSGPGCGEEPGWECAFVLWVRGQ